MPTKGSGKDTCTYIQNFYKVGILKVKFYSTINEVVLAVVQFIDKLKTGGQGY